MVSRHLLKKQGKQREHGAYRRISRDFDLNHCRRSFVHQHKEFVDFPILPMNFQHKLIAHATAMANRRLILEEGGSCCNVQWRFFEGLKKNARPPRNRQKTNVSSGYAFQVRLIFTLCGEGAGSGNTR